jgi:ubiquinone/menaquinone biosynthesis C-methylase UbiE
MPSYWDRFAQAYTQIGEADFWLRHRRRLTEGLSGRILEVCCGGGRLVVELLASGVDAYGIDLSPRMIRLARTKLTQAGLNPRRVAVADVTRLPFADRQFDTVISTGAIALFRFPTQRAALAEMARVAGVEVRLLESHEKRPGWYWGRLWAALFDGMRPIPAALLRDTGLDCSHQWDILGGAFSYLRCAKR